MASIKAAAGLFIQQNPLIQGGITALVGQVARLGLHRLVASSSMQVSLSYEAISLGVGLGVSFAIGASPIALLIGMAVHLTLAALRAQPISMEEALAMARSMGDAEIDPIPGELLKKTPDAGDFEWGRCDFETPNGVQSLYIGFGQDRMGLLIPLENIAPTKRLFGNYPMFGLKPGSFDYSLLAHVPQIGASEIPEHPFIVFGEEDNLLFYQHILGYQTGFPIEIDHLQQSDTTYAPVITMDGYNLTVDWKFEGGPKVLISPAEAFHLFEAEACCDVLKSSLPENAELNKLIFEDYYDDKRLNRMAPNLFVYIKSSSGDTFKVPVEKNSMESDFVTLVPYEGIEVDVPIVLSEDGGTATLQLTPELQREIENALLDQASV